VGSPLEQPAAAAVRYRMSVARWPGARPWPCTAQAQWPVTVWPPKRWPLRVMTSHWMLPSPAKPISASS